MMKRKTLLPAIINSVILIAMSGCQIASPSPVRNVIIHYKQAVNGYMVWVRIDSLDYVHGYPAVLYFQKADRTGFHISVDAYFDAGLGGILLPGKHYRLDYEPWLEGGFNDKEHYSACPFFFYDIDFDGDDELLVTNWHGGTGNAHAYAVYDGIVDGKTYLKDYPPFTEIDRNVIVDEEAKSISLIFDGGNGAYGCEVYKRMDSHPVLDSASFSWPMSEWERNRLKAYYSLPATDFTLSKVFDEQIDLDTREVIHHKDIYNLAKDYYSESIIGGSVMQERKARRQAINEPIHKTPGSNADHGQMVQAAGDSLAALSKDLETEILSRLDTEQHGKYLAERRAWTLYRTYQLEVICSKIVSGLWDTYSGGSAGASFEVDYVY